jgi:hypothetical protein
MLKGKELGGIRHVQNGLRFYPGIIIEDVERNLYRLMVCLFVMSGRLV